MSSPRRRAKLPVSQGRRLSEPSLPLHIALAWIIERVFPLTDDCSPVPVYSQRFVAAILAIVARQVFEVDSQPATFASLRDELDPLIKAELADVSKRNNKKRNRGQIVLDQYEDAVQCTSWMGVFSDQFRDSAAGCAYLDRLEKELRDRLNYADDEEPTELPEPIERHSPLGVFSRNLLNTLRKLSFDETAHLSREIAAWCGHDTAGPSNHAGIWSLDSMEDTLDKRVKAMQDYQSSQASGDYSNALSSLRRFYDYQFPSSGRGQHQHALLNIASFHYATGGLDAARGAVEEAIRVARTAGDKACLQHCLSLAQRLKTETKMSAFSDPETIRIQQKPISSSRLPEGITPMDRLWSVKPALDLGEPVHIAFRRIHSALGRDLETDPPANDEDRRRAKQWKTGEKLDITAWHATQASLWGMLGSGTLADYHEDLALAGVSPWPDGKLTVMLSKARRATDRAEYEEALAILLDMSLLRGMTISAYHRWARVVWSILERRAKLHGDTDSVDYLSAMQPPKSSSKRRGPGGPSRETGHPEAVPLGTDASETTFSRSILLVQEEIRDTLRKAQKLQEASAPWHLILPHVLSAVQLSSELGLWALHRFAVVILGEVILSMQGLAEKAIKEVEAVWDQILRGDDLEALARGALVLGKAHVEQALDADSDTVGSTIASAYLWQALEAAKKLESRVLILETTSIMALVAGLDGDDDGAQADLLAREYVSTRDEMNVAAQAVLARQVGEIVKLVGVKVAQGWM
ncbi:hypothetical protein IAU60_000959 [Kwoniella sp. DSM 27419]